MKTAKMKHNGPVLNQCYIDFQNFYYLRNSILTNNYLLFSFCHLVSNSITFWDDSHLEHPISKLFIDESFTKEHWILTISTFELHHGINIPDEFLDFNLTIREFIDKVTLLPKLSNEEYKIYLEDHREIIKKLL